MAKYSPPKLVPIEELTDIELGTLTPLGTATASAADPLPRAPKTGKKKSIVRRKCLDPMKAFCENHPNWSIVVFILFISFCLTMSIVLLTLIMSIWDGQGPMTDEMRDAIEHLPGFNKGIYGNHSSHH